VLGFLGSPNHGFSKLGKFSISNPKTHNSFQIKPNRLASLACLTLFLIFFPSSAGFRGVPVPLANSIHSFSTRFTLNRPTLKPEQTTVTTSRLFYPCASPLEPCALLYLLPRTTPFCIDLPPCTACCRPAQRAFLFALTPLSCRSFLNSLLRLLTRAVITRYTSLPASPRSLLHVIHISTIDTTRIQSLCTIFLVQCRLLSVTLCRLDFRCPSGYPSRIHPFASCRNIHMSFTCIPYIASKPRSASKSASTLTAERTSLHLLDPVPSYSASSVFVLSLLFLFLWDLSIGNGRK
jgi:hypothetical protein